MVAVEVVGGGGAHEASPSIGGGGGGGGKGWFLPFFLRLGIIPMHFAGNFWGFKVLRG